MKLLVVLALLLLFAGCISNAQDKNGNKTVKIIGENIYDEREDAGGGAEENLSADNNSETTRPNEEENETKTNEIEKIEGIHFGDNKYILVLIDISMQRNEIGYCALFEIVEVENGSSLQKMQICPGDDATWASPEGMVYRIKVFDTAAGYSGRARWAKVAVYG